jgi:hypothetical protein
MLVDVTLVGVPNERPANATPTCKYSCVLTIKHVSAAIIRTTAPVTGVLQGCYKDVTKM